MGMAGAVRDGHSTPVPEPATIPRPTHYSRVVKLSNWPYDRRDFWETEDNFLVLVKLGVLIFIPDTRYQIPDSNPQKDNFHKAIYDLDTHNYYDILAMNFIF
jgi:hypothetical protein